MKKSNKVLLLVAGMGLGCSGSSIVGGGVDASADGGGGITLPTDVPDSLDGVVLRGGAGFDPAVNGFSFENYGAPMDDAGVPLVTNLTPSEMQRLFGGTVCEDPAAPSCVLTPQAQNWSASVSNAMHIGHCEGMAILSLLMWQGLVPPSGFVPTATRAFDLPMSNVALQRELALWWSTQMLPALGTSTQPTAADLVNTLQAAYQPGSMTAYTLAIFLAGGGGGHAITPFGVTTPVNGDSNAADISVYDNNYPGQTKVIHITNLMTGEWNYSASQNPSVQAMPYTGSNAANRIGLRLVNDRLAMPTACAFCGDYTVPATPPIPPLPSMLPEPRATGGLRQIIISGASDLLLVDGANERLGLMSGAVVNQIPGALYQQITGIDPTVQTVLPSFFVPEGVALQANLTPPTVTPPAGMVVPPSSIRVVGRGYTMGVDGFVVNPGTTDTVTFAGTGPGILYLTSQMESPVLSVSSQNPGADYAMYVQLHNTSAGMPTADGGTPQALALMSLDQASTTLRIQFNGETGAMNTFDLLFNRTDSNGTVATFRHLGNTAVNGAIVTFNYGMWTGPGAPVVEGITLPGSTTPMMTMVTDQSMVDGGVPTTDGGMPETDGGTPKTDGGSTMDASVPVD